MFAPVGGFDCSNVTKHEENTIAQKNKKHDTETDENQLKRLEMDRICDFQGREHGTVFQAPFCSLYRQKLFSFGHFGNFQNFHLRSPFDDSTHSSSSGVLLISVEFSG